MSTLLVASKLTIEAKFKVVCCYVRMNLEDCMFRHPNRVFASNKRTYRDVPHNASQNYLTTCIKRGASIGTNAALLCGVMLQEYLFVAVTVSKDIPIYAVVTGVPARIID